MRRLLQGIIVLCVALTLFACDSSSGGGSKKTDPVIEFLNNFIFAVSGNDVNIDASATDDADGDPLTYAWDFTLKPAGSILDMADIVGNDTATPQFLPDLDGEYKLELTVNDGTTDVFGTVTVNVSPFGAPPVANAGPDQNAATEVLVTLDGSGSSDPEAQALTYSWSMSAPAGSASALSDATAMNPTFTPDISGDYIFMLVVNDGGTDSPADTVMVTATFTNAPPNANAGPDQTVSVTDTVTLDGTDSNDANAGQTLTYAWTKTAGPAVSLSSETAASPTFVPTVAGDYVFSLIVNDGIDNSTTADTVTITVLANPQPTADAGADQEVMESTNVILDGSGSSDPDGEPLTYAWSFTAIPTGSTAVLDDSTAINPAFTADLPGTYTLSLVANDTFNDSPADTVTITVLAQPIGSTVTVSLTGLASGTTLGSLDLSFDYDETSVDYATVSAGTLTPGSTIIPNATDPDFVRIGLLKFDGFDASAAGTVMELTFDVTTGIPVIADYIITVNAATDLAGSPVAVTPANIVVTVVNNLHP